LAGRGPIERHSKIRLGSRHEKRASTNGGYLAFRENGWESEPNVGIAFIFAPYGACLNKSLDRRVWGCGHRQSPAIEAAPHGESGCWPMEPSSWKKWLISDASYPRRPSSRRSRRRRL